MALIAASRQSVIHPRPLASAAAPNGGRRGRWNTPLADVDSIVCSDCSCRLRCVQTAAAGAATAVHPFPIPLLPAGAAAACTPGKAGCKRCRNGRCVECKRAWMDSTGEWFDGFGLTSRGTCVRCKPRGPFRNYWCAGGRGMEARWHERSCG